MGAYVLLLVFFLAVGRMLGRDRKTVRARWAVAVSVPLGLLLGSQVGGLICVLALRHQGKGGSHNDTIAVTGAWMAGAMLGTVISFVAASWITRDRSDGK